MKALNLLKQNLQTFFDSSKSIAMLCVEMHTRFRSPFCIWVQHILCATFLLYFLTFKTRCHTMGCIYSSRIIPHYPYLGWREKLQTIMSKITLDYPNNKRQKALVSLGRLKVMVRLCPQNSLNMLFRIVPLANKNIFYSMNMGQ